MLGEPARELQVIGLLPRMKAQVLQQQHAARGQRLDRRADTLAHAVVAEGHRRAD